mgnify:CR=1 FL=1
MTRLRREKRKQLLVLVVCAVLGTAAMGYGILGTQQRVLSARADELAEVAMMTKHARHGLELAPQFKADYEAGRQELARQEELMAKGDPYRWVIKTLEKIQSDYRVSIATIEPPEIGELKTPPALPYKAATFRIKGNACYHDLGSFLAAVENRLPYLRVNRLVLQSSPTGYTSLEDKEKLAFELEFENLLVVTPTRFANPAAPAQP